MFNLQEHRTHQKHLADQLIWFGLVAKSIILNKNGSLQRTVELMGFDLETSSIELLTANCNKLNHIFKQIGSNWALYFDVVRQKSISYPKTTFTNQLALLIDLERKDRFELENNFVESKYYLTFVWLPPKDSEVSITNRFIKQSNGQAKIDRAKDLENFTKATDSLIDSLRYSFLHVNSLNDEATLTYLHSLISNVDHVVNMPIRTLYLDYLLSDTSLVGGLEPKLGNRFFKVLTIRFFPNHSFPGLLDGLNHLNTEFRWTTRWIALDKNDAMTQINKKAKNWMSKRISLMKIIGQIFHFTASAESNNAEATINQFDAEDAKLALANNQVGFGYYTATIIVHDYDLEACQTKLNKIKNFINDRGFVAKEETINAVDAWFGSLPGHTHANVRFPLLGLDNTLINILLKNFNVPLH
jgi:type IV secretion system protein TrbE